MSKEEILGNPFYPEQCGSAIKCVQYYTALNAMNTFGKYEAIEFTNWTHELECSYRDGNWEVYTPVKYEGEYTTEQLYELFLKSKSDPNDLPPTVGGGFGK